MIKLFLIRNIYLIKNWFYNYQILKIGNNINTDYLDKIKLYDKGKYDLEDILEFLTEENYYFVLEEVSVEKSNKVEIINNLKKFPTLYNEFRRYIENKAFNETIKKIELEDKITENIKNYLWNKFRLDENIPVNLFDNLCFLIENIHFTQKKIKYSNLCYISDSKYYLFLCEYKKNILNRNQDKLILYRILITGKVKLT